MVKHKEHIPRRVCTSDRLKRLKKAGFDTTGYDRDMESILKSKGFGLPSLTDDGEFGFTVNHKYIRICLNRADALAEEIILLHKLKLLK